MNQDNDNTGPRYNGLVCPICKGLQYDTPSGVTCPMGHGGLEGVSTVFLPPDAGKVPGKMTTDELYKELTDGKTPTSRTPSEPAMQELPPKEAQPKYHYALVLGEVIFETMGTVHSRRAQIFSKADIPEFTAGRLLHVQNSLAFQVRNELGNPNDFKAIEALILNVAPLGHMTDDEFYRDVKRGPEAPEPNAAGGTVVPFKLR